MTIHYYREGRSAPGAGRGAAPSAGGNAFSHRVDSIPGCTLYAPASQCVPPARHTRLTERDAKAPLPHRQAEDALLADAATTTYAASHPFPAGVDFSVDPRVRRPGGITQTTAAPLSPEAPGFGRSTYQMELLQRSKTDIDGSKETASSSARGSPKCGSGAGLGGAAGSASAPCSPAAQRLGIAAVRPGYLTTAAAASIPVAEQYQSRGWSAGAAPRAQQAACSAPSSPLAGCRPGSGTFGGGQAAACLRDPPLLAHPAARPSSGSACMGGQAQAQGQGQPGSSCQQQQAGSRGHTKDAAFLYALDQHSRGRLPSYTGHRPQHNAVLEPPPPSKQTAWGEASQEALRRSLPQQGTGSHGIKSSLLGFFSAGASAATGGFISENGLTEAARFHETTRPLEGRMKIPQAGHTNRQGGRFAS